MEFDIELLQVCKVLIFMPRIVAFLKKVNYFSYTLLKTTNTDCEHFLDFAYFFSDEWVLTAKVLLDCLHNTFGNAENLPLFWFNLQWYYLICLVISTSQSLYVIFAGKLS